MRAKPLKIATWNVNSLRVRLPHVLDWLAAERPDVVALQETKLADDLFPIEAVAEAGYRAVFSGQKTYNGVAIFARAEPLDPVCDLPGLEDPARRLLAATVGDLRIVSVYVPNGQSVGTEKYAYKLRWLDRLGTFLGEELGRHAKTVVLGDFNVAPEDRDVHDPEAWRGRILFSEPEKEAFRTLLAAGFRDAFRLFEQPAGEYSWWDYRVGAFRRNLGLRIDHILVSEALVPACRACRVDRAPRALDRPSDHAPVVLEIGTGEGGQAEAGAVAGEA